MGCGGRWVERKTKGRRFNHHPGLGSENGSGIGAKSGHSANGKLHKPLAAVAC